MTAFPTQAEIEHLYRGPVGDGFLEPLLVGAMDARKDGAGVVRQGAARECHLLPPPRRLGFDRGAPGDLLALYWIGRDMNGSRVVWRFNGYTPERVSTHPIENIIRQWPTVEDALAFSFQFNGHALYCIYSTHNDTTLVYDISVGLWVEFSVWHPVLMRDIPWPIRCAVTAWNGQVFVGSSNSGLIYRVVMGVYTDEAVI